MHSLCTLMIVVYELYDHVLYELCDCVLNEKHIGNFFFFFVLKEFFPRFYNV